MPLEGDLAHFRLADILQVVSHQRKTGILTIQGKSDILAVSFLDGGIVAADALNQSLDDLLGGVLARRNLIEPARFARLVEEQRRAGSRLFEFLVEQRAVSRQQLLESIEDLTYHLILDVLLWREGQFKFYGGEEVAHEEGVHPLRVEDLLMRSIRDLPSEEGRAPSQVSGVATYLPTGGGRPVKRIPEGFDEATPLDPGTIWVTPDEETILARLDGRTPAETLARLSGLGETRAYYALSRLVSTGLARELAAGEEVPALAAPARTAPPAEALRVERHVVHAADEARPGSHPLGDRPAALARALPVVAAVAAIWIVLAAPGALLFPAPGQGDLRAAFERTRRLSRFSLIDRGARTYHLLEGRYPGSIAELVERGLLPRRALGKLDGQRYEYRPRSEEYEILLHSDVESAGGLREGVFGDFLLDRSLFADLERDTGVPIVLID